MLALNGALEPSRVVVQVGSICKTSEFGDGAGVIVPGEREECDHIKFLVVPSQAATQTRGLPRHMRAHAVRQRERHA